ncbi:MAG: class I SAM-dependent methyltransferase [Candidatus Paceibacterota bacterium]
MAYNDLPEAYKKGFINFLGIKIGLENRPLIPREETEFWASQALKDIEFFIKKNKRKKISCLDIFSGSGCLGIALLKKNSQANCDFGEIEDSFLEQIKKNLKENKVSLGRYQIIKSDIFSNILKKYDFILANPPYVAEKRIAEVGEDVKKYEPAIALFAGPEGMDVLKIFIVQVFDFLKKKGTAYVEIDSEQVKEIEKIINRLPIDKRYSQKEFLKDQFGKIRVLKIIK